MTQKDVPLDLWTVWERAGITVKPRFKRNSILEKKMVAPKFISELKNTLT